jgi:hypothetical protein
LAETVFVNVDVDQVFLERQRLAVVGRETFHQLLAVVVETIVEDEEHIPVVELTALSAR